MRLWQPWKMYVLFVYLLTCVFLNANAMNVGDKIQWICTNIDGWLKFNLVQSKFPGIS